MQTTRQEGGWHPWRCLLLVVWVLALPSVWAGKEYPAQPGDRVVANELIIRLKPGTLPSAVVPGFLANALTRALKLANVYVVQVPNGIPAGITALLAAHPLVDFVEPNRMRHVVVNAPNDPGYLNSSSGQWGLFNIQAQQGWNLLNAPYLTAGTADEPGQSSDSRHRHRLHPPGLHELGREFDRFGRWRPVPVERQPGVCRHHPVFARPAYGRTTRPRHACDRDCGGGHGQRLGVASLGYPARSDRILRCWTASGSGDDATIANAIVAAADAGSAGDFHEFGGSGYSQTLQSAINYAWQRNAVVVRPAGNSGNSSLFFPGGANHVLGISATDINNNLASFSNYGNGISLAAPGVNILSTIPTYGVTLGCCNYGFLSGTSMSTPFVSALAGLVAMSTPNAAAGAIMERLEQTAALDTTGGAWSQSFGYGLINSYNAIGGVVRTTSTGGVVGQIVNGNGNAVSNAQVTINGRSFTTDSSGLYWIRAVAAGTYGVTVTAPGYVAQSLSATVTAGADTVFPVAMGTVYGSFTGAVTDQGADVAGAIVQALSGGLIVGSATTDGAGHYTLWVPGGSGYTVQASQIGRNTASVASAGVVAGGSTTVNLSMSSLLGTIAGTVTDTNSNAIARRPGNGCFRDLQRERDDERRRHVCDRRTAAGKLRGDGLGCGTGLDYRERGNGWGGLDYYREFPAHRRADGGAPAQPRRGHLHFRAGGDDECHPRCRYPLYHGRQHAEHHGRHALQRADHAGRQHHGEGHRVRPRADPKRRYVRDLRD